MTTCEVVAERVAVGEPLGELAAHVATCAACTQLAALPALLGATHHAADPGAGFAARVTGAAQRRLVVRRQRRIATALGTVVVAAAAVALAVTQLPTRGDSRVAASQPPAPSPTPVASEHPTPPAPTPAPNPPAPTPAPEPAPVPRVHDAEVAALVRFARVDHSRRLSANWARITAPLAPYRSLVAHQGEVP